MNEYNLHRILGLLADASGLTQPKDFLHSYMGCMGSVMDVGSHWQCQSCGSQAHKRPVSGQPNGMYETNKNPSPQAQSFISSQLGPVGSAYYNNVGPPMPVAMQMPPITEETIRKALGIDKETMDRFVEEITRPEPKTPLEHLDQDLRKYTERA